MRPRPKGAVWSGSDQLPSAWGFLLGETERTIILTAASALPLDRENHRSGRGHGCPRDAAHPARGVRVHRRSKLNALGSCEEVRSACKVHAAEESDARSGDESGGGNAGAEDPKRGAQEKRGRESKASGPALGG